MFEVSLVENELREEELRVDFLIEICCKVSALATEIKKPINQWNSLSLHFYLLDAELARWQQLKIEVILIGK